MDNKYDRPDEVLTDHKLPQRMEEFERFSGTGRIWPQVLALAAIVIGIALYVILAD